MFKSIQKIISLLEDKTVLKWEFLFKEGDKDMCFYIISSGKIEINKSTQTGGFKTIALLNGGEFLGEGALSRSDADHVRPANALALEDTHLLVLRREKFNGLLKNDPETALDFIYKILEVTYTRLKFSNAELVTLYEVGRLIGLYLDDLNTLAYKILSQVKEVTKSNNALMIIRDNLSGKKEVIGKIGDFDGMKVGRLEELSSSIVNDLFEVKKYWFQKQKILLAQIEKIGFILLTRSEKERDYTDAHLKLLNSVAEQSQAAIERARKIRDEKAKKIYEQRKLQYNF